MGSSWRLTRWLFLRGLGLIYVVAFLVSVEQGPGLFGSRGITPAARQLDRVAASLGGRWDAFWQAPSIFWLDASDAALRTGAWVGLGGAVALFLGVDHVLLIALLWALYLSFVHVGGIWYGYGWELLLCEAGALAIFLGSGSLRSAPALPDAGLRVMSLLYRWLSFRLMFGAGLIKIRGDECWRQLTCLQSHYETQPNPTPLAWLLHQAPPWFHTVGALWNHLVELALPLFVFAPRPVRLLAGWGFVAFQVILIATGNLSFLNWLSLLVCLWCLDDEALGGLVPRRWRATAGAGEQVQEQVEVSRWRMAPIGALVVLVAVRSVGPAVNLLDPEQVMNTSYDPWLLVNSYGAFGSVSEARIEAVIQGSNAEVPGEADWQDYELPCKPGDVRRRPCVITPYHLRLDWQMWFVPLRPDLLENQWLVRLAYELLRGNPDVQELFEVVPFEDHPPRWIRVALYRYRFTRWGEAPGAWWVREPQGVLLRPVTGADPTLLRFLGEASSR